MYRETFKDSPILWVDTGNWSETLSPDGLIKTRTLLSAMDDLGYVAANISERELTNGYEPFLELKKTAKFPLVSANMVFQADGKPIVAPYTIVTLEPKKYKSLKKPLRVAIAGVTRFNPTFLKSAPPKNSVIIANPQDELKKYMPEMQKKADQIIVLAAMSKDDAHLIAKEIPGINMILGGFGGLSTAVEEKEGNTSIFFVGNQGKYLGEFRAFLEDGVTSLKTNLHYLGASYPEDATMKSKVDAALAEINNVGKAAAMQATQPVRGSAASLSDDSKTYQTSEVCQGCHLVEYTIWSKSKHAHAMETLVHKEADFNPECVACHTLGFKKKGGFVDAKSTADLINVQCESCHGPATRHLMNPKAPYGKAGRPSCIGCHNKENSPGFEFDSYWAKIKHGT